MVKVTHILWVHLHIVEDFVTFLVLTSTKNELLRINRQLFVSKRAVNVVERASLRGVMSKSAQS